MKCTEAVTSQLCVHVHHKLMQVMAISGKELNPAPAPACRLYFGYAIVSTVVNTTDHELH